LPTTIKASNLLEAFFLPMCSSTLLLSVLLVCFILSIKKLISFAYVIQK